MEVTLKSEFHVEGEKFPVGTVTFDADALLELNRGCTHAFEGLLTLHVRNDCPSTPAEHKELNELSIHIQKGSVFNWVRIAGIRYCIITDLRNGQNQTEVHLTGEVE